MLSQEERRQGAMQQRQVITTWGGLCSRAEERKEWLRIFCVYGAEFPSTHVEGLVGRRRSWHAKSRPWLFVKDSASSDGGGCCYMTRKLWEGEIQEDMTSVKPLVVSYWRNVDKSYDIVAKRYGFIGGRGGTNRLSPTRYL
jgi:hypothetical protein